LPTLDDVYRKFGETAEAAQLLETELGTMLLEVRVSDEDQWPDPGRAKEILQSINRQTLGQLLKNLKERPPGLEDLLEKALEARNRLQHSFYRQHNFRRNTDEGITLMLQDLEAIHGTLVDAFKAVMLLSGVNLDAPPAGLSMPTRRVPIA
jgi:hypothetical protein